MSNPILNEKMFTSQERILEGEPMSVQGTIGKIFMLFVCLLAGAGISLYYLFNGQSATVFPMTIFATVVGFILVMATCFNVKIAKYTAAPYALLEGIVLGGVSAFFEATFQGIVIQAIMLTFASLFVMLMLYKAKLIQYTETFRSVLLTAILSVGAIYFVQIILSLFSRTIPGIFDNGPVGIIFSLVVVAIASLSLIQDFYFIESASNNLMSKDYEWYGAMGLMITLVWLYMEILRLLAKLNSRR